MTPQEWTAVKEHVEALWGRTRKWAQYGRLINQVGHVTFEDAIKVVDRSVGGYIPSPATIIAINARAGPGLRRLVYVPVVCGEHRLELVEGPFGPPHRVCRNVGCDYETGDHDG